ncbi:unnamed protein product [Paramecium primaurelia]|uniref:Uncharacterized protein n=1 Tax=Paramecium primaurelia TaxID=5886 RepID=A0A8S1N6A4_PARPR|nr:unnamed protein product [Paramecium primaurelia]
MLHLQYVTEEVYTFENEEDIIKAISLDQFQPNKLDPLNKSISYKINHNKCIRLRDLIFWIESDFVRIHLGQLLYLILSILQKVQYIENKGIGHNYLDLNRIWIQLSEISQYPSLIYQFLDYSIHFTGYNCSLKDKYLYQQQASIKIKVIIKIIIDKCFNRIQLKKNNNNQEIRNQIYQQILQPIIDLCNSNQSINIIIEYIKQKLNDYNYQYNQNNKLIQSLNIDDNENDYIGSKRYKLIQKVNNDIKQIIQFGQKYGIIIIEYLLNYSIPRIANNLKSYSLIDYQKKALKQQNIQNERYKELTNMIEQHIQEGFKYYLDEYSNYYKFNINQKEIKQLEQEIINSILQSPQVKYFYNTYWFQQNEQIVNYIVAAITKISKKEIEDKLETLLFYLHVELIDQLM